MMIIKMLRPILLSSLLVSCGLFGEYFPQYETAPVSKNFAGYCFQIKNASDYYAHYISIRDRNATERSGFNRKLPALKIENDQLCIPQTYYHFPKKGEVNVDIALRSPTKVMQRRFIMSEFKIVNGVPYPFNPRDYSVPIPDAEDYQ